MGYHAITSVGRRLDAGRIEHLKQLSQPMPAETVGKWEVLRELTLARAAFGLSDRDLSVLQALLSFYPGTQLDDPQRMIVHPANATICERLNGMPCSTMRRHLARLIEAGLLVRHDSPNGKRYVRRAADGETRYGFDLSPLARRCNEIRTAAAMARDEAETIALMREEISLMRRDLFGLLELAQDRLGATPPQLDRFTDLAALSARMLRRKLDRSKLAEIRNSFHIALSQIRALIPVELSTSDARNEQHIQSSNKEILESENCAETKEGAVQNKAHQPRLAEIVSACPEILTYADTPISDWPDLILTAETVRPMMGINSSSWQEAKRRMGAATAAVALAAILQRFGDIRSPGAYLRSLAKKAGEGKFSPGPMIYALSRCGERSGSQL